eukprot:3338587-Amphidinium_carterae.1
MEYGPCALPSILLLATLNMLFGLCLSCLLLLGVSSSSSSPTSTSSWSCVLRVAKISAHPHCFVTTVVKCVRRRAPCKLDHKRSFGHIDTTCETRSVDPQLLQYNMALEHDTHTQKK